MTTVFGICEIDEQHRVLVTLVNKLYTALVTNIGDSTIKETVAELVQHTRIHFAVEECLMRLFGCPNFAEHKATHDRIVKGMRSFQVDCLHRGHEAGMDLLYLKDWLMEHIKEEETCCDPQCWERLARLLGLATEPQRP
jgi:hemerythrin